MLLVFKLRSVQNYTVFLANFICVYITTEIVQCLFPDHHFDQIQNTVQISLCFKFNCNCVTLGNNDFNVLLDCDQPCGVELYLCASIVVECKALSKR